MQTLAELGMDMTRAGFETALRFGAQAAEAYRQCARLQAESAGKLLDESVRVSRVLLDDEHASGAIVLWGKACEQGMTRSFEAARRLSEAALRTQSALAENGVKLIDAGGSAMLENLNQLARAWLDGGLGGAEAAPARPSAVTHSHKKAA
jgi:hypothetical protein